MDFSDKVFKVVEWKWEWNEKGEPLDVVLPATYIKSSYVCMSK